MGLQQTFTITGTSPGSASTAVLGSQVNGLLGYNWFTVHANLVGATGGALNVYVQRLIDRTADVWSDWISFPQLTAGASAIQYAVDSGTQSTITATGGGSTASPAPALAAGTSLGGHPGNSIRVVCVAGSGTTVGAAVTVYVSCQRVR